MLDRIGGLLALSLLAFLSPQQNQVQQTPITASELYKAASPSVVLIETYGEDGKVSGAGSGFLVSANGKILTNYHVIAHSKRATVRLANEDAYDDVTVLDIDKRKDIALIKIKAVGLPFLKLGHSGSLLVGDKLYALGNPLGVFQNTLSEGIMSAVRQLDGYKMFQLSTPISHGSSGGPVFDSSGNVVAIIEATSEEGQNINFALPIDYALGMMDSNQAKTLEAIYEPEEKNTAAPIQTVSAPKLGPEPTAAMRGDAFTYISTKIGIWTKPDAEIELGDPIDRRDTIVNNSVVGDIFKYKSPTPNFSNIELNFSRDSKKVVAAYFVYSSTVSWNTLRGKLGKHYKKQKLPSGAPAYLYVFQNRQVDIIVDSAENVVSVGVW
jgi:trypsin-like peptidase